MKPPHENFLRTVTAFHVPMVISYKREIELL